jgi:hypothetical protein
MAKVAVASDGCWNWTGALSRNGYGRFGPQAGLTVGAHRFAYELLVGPIPEGLDLDHLCRNRRCVNPAHLEPVGRSENLARGATARGLAADPDAATALYLRGLSTVEVARRLGVGRSTVRRVIVAAGVMRSRQEAIAFRGSSRA